MPRRKTYFENDLFKDQITKQLMSLKEQAVFWTCSVSSIKRHRYFLRVGKPQIEVTKWSSAEKTCEICNQRFKTIKFGGTRRYCFDCLPKNSVNPIGTIRKSARMQGIALLGGSCCNCGDDRHYVLDFHHVDSNEKEESVAYMLRNNMIKAFFVELEKCILYCANCHREYHYKSRNGELAQLVEQETENFRVHSSIL